MKLKRFEKYGVIMFVVLSLFSLLSSCAEQIPPDKTVYTKERGAWTDYYDKNGYIGSSRK